MYFIMTFSFTHTHTYTMFFFYHIQLITLSCFSPIPINLFPSSSYPLIFSCRVFAQYFLKIFFIYVHMGVYVYTSLYVFVWVHMHTCVGACEDQKKAYLLELKLLVCVSHLAWVLGSKFWSSQLSTKCSYCWAISPVLFFWILLVSYLLNP